MNWLLWSLLSAFFAGLTAILAKIGIAGVDSNLATAVRTTVVLVFAWAVVLLTLTPLLPGALYVRACLRFVRGMDELQRRIQMEAWLFAALGTLIIGTIINTLNANGVALGVLKHSLSLWGTFVLAFALWLVGTAIAKCRYQ